MKFISVRDLRIRPGYVWEKLKREDEIVITSNGRPIALLTSLDEETLEFSISAFRQSKAMIALQEMQKEAVKRKLNKISTEEIEFEIKEARKARKR